jgi:diguanylate cyclase (GGDEF)-like protein
MATGSIAAAGQATKTGHTVPGKSRKSPKIAKPRPMSEELVAPMTDRTEEPPFKILICDDDPADHELVRTCLQRTTGREIVLLDVAHTKEIADALDKHRIDLVLMDSQMPGKSGMQWLSEIPERQLAPVIMLTASAVEEVTAQTFQEEAVTYLPKSSLSQGKLKDIVNVTLDKWVRLQQAGADEEKLEKLATVDSLTGLYNRRVVLSKLRDLINLATRYREDFSLSVLDIDHFGVINDHYGHLAGDEALTRIASLIRQNVRDTDIVGRYGGEEFLVVLPKTNLSSSWVAAERLRNAIEKTEFSDSVGNLFTITVSQGLAAWERNDDVASLVSRANEALHKARERGRNRVQILLGPSLRDKI